MPDRPFDLVNHPYLVDIYNCIAKRIVIMKAGQVGISEYMISHSLWSADQRKATVLYVFPTDSHVSDFSSARIGPAIEASPYLSSIVIEGKAAGGQRGADRVTLKRVRDRFVYLRGAKVDTDGTAAQLKSIDADILCLDELDEMDNRAPEIARKRLGHSLIAEERTASTPTYSGRGIHAEYQATDQREWQTRCEHCGNWQTTAINDVVKEWDALGRPTRWNGQGTNRAFVSCQKCGKELTGQCQWVAAYPSRDVIGFHVTKFCSPRVDLPAIVKTLESVDETKRKECFNQDLGEPHTPRGGQITDEILDACRRDYAHEARVGEYAVMGIDIGSVLYGVIRGRADRETGEVPQRWAGEIESFEAIPFMMQKYNVATLVIDALPETTKARELQAKFRPGVVWLAYYTLHSKHGDYIQWDADDLIVSTDRTRALDAMFARLYAGKATLPANARDVRDYYKHLKSQVKVVNGNAASYVETGPDHFAHAENYCMIAESFLADAPPAQEVIYAPVKIGPDW